MFSVVIPVYPPHFGLLDRIINNILSSDECDNLVHEIIIACSEVSDKSIMSNFISRMDKVKILNDPNKGNAAYNRNRGWSIASGRYVCFMDADDLFHLQRFSILRDVIDKWEPKAIVHDYYRHSIMDWKQINELNIIHSDFIYDKTFPEGKRDLSLENGDNGNCNLNVGGFDVQHGQATILNNVYPEICYNVNMNWGEDGRILRDILYKNKQDGVIFINEKLTLYTY